MRAIRHIWESNQEPASTLFQKPIRATADKWCWMKWWNRETEEGSREPVEEARPLSTASGLPGQIYGVNSSRTASFRFRSNSHKMLPITAPAFLAKADEPYMDQTGDLCLPKSTSHHFGSTSIHSFYKGSMEILDERSLMRKFFCGLL